MDRSSPGKTSEDQKDSGYFEYRTTQPAVCRNQHPQLQGLFLYHLQHGAASWRRHQTDRWLYRLNQYARSYPRRQRQQGQTGTASVVQSGVAKRGRATIIT